MVYIIFSIKIKNLLYKITLVLWIIFIITYIKLFFRNTTNMQITSRNEKYFKYNELNFIFLNSDPLLLTFQRRNQTEISEKIVLT